MMSGLSPNSPVPRVPPACKRCSVNKKKCDRLSPRCTGCVAADAACEPMIKAGDRRLMRQIEDMREESLALKRQIAELQQELRRQDTSTSTDTFLSPPSRTNVSSLPALPLAFLTGNEHPVLSRNLRHLCPLQYVFSSFNLNDAHCSDGASRSDLDPWKSAEHTLLRPDYVDLLPTMNEMRSIIQSLAEATKHGPSNLDKIISLSQLQEDCRLVYGPGGLESSLYSGSRFRCFVTVYLAMSMTGAAAAENITTDPRALACLATGIKELSLMTEKVDFACVEALTLLSELSIHAAIGLNLGQLIGFATRTAVAINLHRQDDVYLPTVYGTTYLSSQKSEEMAAHNQRRKDLFWALYSLDRLAAFIFDRPPCLSDADIDVDVPPATMWPEGKYATLSSEALWVHHIQSRRLYGQIQSALYSPVRAADDASDSRKQETVSGYMQQVQQWYMKSRFNSTVIPFSEESIKRHVLDDIQYHQMVMALHQPSTLIPEISSTSLATLYRSATLSVGLFHHAASRKQLNIHWINLHQAFASCATLIYCLRQQQARGELRKLPPEKIVSTITQCREVISLFKGIGPVVQQYQEMLELLIDAFQAQRTCTNSPSDISQPSCNEGSSEHASQASPTGMDFEMGLTFDAEMFPGITENGFLEGPSNILSPTYWMDSGQTRTDQSDDKSRSLGSHADKTSIPPES